jgi:cytochrome c oxidase cbb3-type subunit III
MPPSPRNIPLSHWEKIFYKTNDTFNFSNLIGSATKSFSAATGQMTHVRSRITTWSKAGFILFSSRHFLCVAAASLFFAAFVLVLQASAQNKKSSARKNQAGDLAAEVGQKTYGSVCATCHGLDGRGGERGPNIATRAEVQQLSDEETLHLLQTGIPVAGMPAFEALGVPKISAIVAYLRVLQGGGKASPILGDAQRGKLLFFGKARCANCHMISGFGGFIGADLTSYGSNRSAKEIRTAITDPNMDLEPRERTLLVTTREGRQFAGIARNEDNFSLQLQSLDGTFHLFSKKDLEHFEYLPKSLMPSDYGSVLSATELDDLMSYLVRAARTAKKAQASGTKSELEEEED